MFSLFRGLMFFSSVITCIVYSLLFFIVVLYSLLLCFGAVIFRGLFYLCFTLLVLIFIVEPSCFFVLFIFLVILTICICLCFGVVETVIKINKDIIIFNIVFCSYLESL